MYLKKAKQKNGRIYLSIADGYYDKQKGHSRTVIIEKLGYLDDLEKQYDDPIAFFKQRVQKLKEEKAERTASISVTFSPEDKISSDITYRRSFGHTVVSKIYHSLEINKFLISRQRTTKLDFDTNNIMKLLVFSCQNTSYRV